MLERFAPVVFQERRGADRLDSPAALDFDGSNRLGDDFETLAAGAPTGAAVFYTAASADGERLYLFYGLYYPVDWSGDPAAPRIDHQGDFEGALVVVSRGDRRVEAVITQAHRIFYLWSVEAATPGASGALACAAERPLLFAESGGHGLYGFGLGRWRPRGGRRLAGGPAATPLQQLLRIASDTDARHPGLGVHAELRPLADLQRFTASPAGGFRELHKASPPWLWADRRGGRGPRGEIVADPGRLYARLRATRRP